MNTPCVILILIFLPLVLAAPHISPREDGCPIGATSVPSVTYTMMAPVQTIMIDRAQEDGCPWLKDANQPALSPPITSAGASNSGTGAADGAQGQRLQPSPPANPDGAFDIDASPSSPANTDGGSGQAAQPSPSADGSFDPAGLSGSQPDGTSDDPAGSSPSVTGGWIPGFPAPSDLSPDGTNRGPSTDGDLPGGSGGDGGSNQATTIGPGAAVSTGSGGPTRTLEAGNFGQGLPTDASPTTADITANNPKSTLRTQVNPPPSSTSDGPPRFVHFAGSSSRNFEVPRIHRGPLCLAIMTFWVLFNLVQ